MSDNAIRIHGGNPYGKIKIREPGTDGGELTIKGELGAHYQTFDGPYEAEALLEQDQTFRTEGLVMKKDMTFLGMKVRVVTNPAGGLTYYVGE